jgi:hypothetical protein
MEGTNANAVATARATATEHGALKHMFVSGLPIGVKSEIGDTGELLSAVCMMMMTG